MTEVAVLHLSYVQADGEGNRWSGRSRNFVCNVPRNCWFVSSGSLENVSPRLSISSSPMRWVDEKQKLILEVDLGTGHSCEISRFFQFFFFPPFLGCFHPSSDEIHPRPNAASSRDVLARGMSSSRFSASEPQPDDALSRYSHFPEIRALELFCFPGEIESAGHCGREKCPTPGPGHIMGVPAAFFSQHPGQQNR